MTSMTRDGNTVHINNPFTCSKTAQIMLNKIMMLWLNSITSGMYARVFEEFDGANRALKLS